MNGKSETAPAWAMVSGDDVTRREALENLRYANRIYLEKIKSEIEGKIAKYEKFRSEEEVKKSGHWKESSILAIYLNIQEEKTDGTIKGIYIEWNRFVFTGPKEKRSAHRISIKKILNSDYFSLAELEKYAKDWEWEYVKKLEEEFSLLRNQIKYIVKSNEALRFALRAEEKYCKSQEGNSKE